MTERAYSRIYQVSDFVHGFCEDGHTFIPNSARQLLATTHTAKVPKKISRTEAKALGLKAADLFSPVPQPKTFSHYVMNLPSTAIDFVPDFIGLYAGHEALFAPHTETKLPMVHCYCFAPKHEDGDPEMLVPKGIICKELSERLGFEMDIGMEDLSIWDVRDVAPNKRQYCASFRIPAEVAYRKR